MSRRKLAALMFLLGQVYATMLLGTIHDFPHALSWLRLVALVPVLMLAPVLMSARADSGV